MIQPNFDLMFWVILILWIISAVFRIIAGAVKFKKSDTYDEGDVVIGIFMLILVIIILLTGSG